ncbi:MAG: sulfatase-like hydrolase/transferase, partial [Pseudomonadales bacterium]|nr:sulfatase-like hydrolase/transferase [Pseudomonadales bacterium]
PHAPHHTKKSDRDKYLGKYQQGWDITRKQRLDRQIEMGLVPEGTKLSPYTPGVVPWSQLSNDQKTMYARFEENYAAFVDNLDQNIGRLISYLKETDQLNNTIIIFTSDNGGSREVSIEGSSNALRYYHYHPSTTAQNLKDFDHIGDITTHPHYPLGWMQTSNTPFIHSKRTAHDGGTRVPLIVSWPAGIKSKGIRHQFHHVNDLAPTLLEMLKIEPPTEYMGMQVKPMEGISMVYSFDNPNAPGQKTRQYYEIEGRRAYYKDGWKIIAYRKPDQRYDETEWELYNLNEDFSASNNLAKAFPEKVKALEKLWWEDAERYDVLPLIDVPLLERPMHTRIWLDEPQHYFEYTPDSDTIYRFKGPVLANRNYTIEAHILRDNAQQQGVLAALGDYYSGYTFYIKNNRLHFELDVAHKVYHLVSNTEIPIGSALVEYRFEKVNLALAIIEGLIKEGTDFDRLSVLRGTGSLWINGKKVAEQKIDQPLFAVWEGLDIGKDQLTPVSDNYQSPFRFEGRLEKLVYRLN